jgi:hypothetical protein
MEIDNIAIISIKKLINSKVEYEYINNIKDIYGIIILPT